MPKNLHALEKQLKLRAFDKKESFIPVGSAMKSKRLSTGLTLEEVSEDICSVSYLSKLENNKVELSEKFSDALFKRLDLKDYQFHVNAHIDEDLSRMCEMMLEKKGDTSKLYKKYEEKIDYQSRLIMMGLAHIEQAYKRVDAYYDLILPYVSQFTDIEVSIFIYLAGVLLYEKGLYEQAYNMVLKSLYQVVDNTHLTLLTEQIKLYSLLKLCRHNDIQDVYEKLFIKLTKSHRYRHLKDIQLALLIYQTQFKSIHEIRSDVDHIEQIDQPIKDYILARSYYRHHQNEKALQHIEDHKFSSRMHTQLYLLILDKLHHAPKKIMDTISNFTSNKLEDTQLKQYLFSKNTLERSEFAEYLKREYFNQGLVVEDCLVLNHLILDGQEVLSQAYFYKDASRIMQTYVRTIQTLTGSGVPA